MAVETESRLDCSNRSAATIDHAEPERLLQSSRDSVSTAMDVR